MLSPVCVPLLCSFMQELEDLQGEVVELGIHSSWRGKASADQNSI